MEHPVPRARPEVGRVRVVLTPESTTPSRVRSLREVLGGRVASPASRPRSRVAAAGVWLAVGLGGVGAAAAVHQIVAPRHADFLPTDLWLPVPDTPLMATWSLVSNWLVSTLRWTGRLTAKVETAFGAGWTGAVSATK